MKTLKVLAAALLASSSASAANFPGTTTVTPGAGLTIGLYQDGSSNNYSPVGITGTNGGGLHQAEVNASGQLAIAGPVTNAGTFATQSAITAASGSIASGAIASGAIASGAIASGAIASGAAVSGAFADGSLVTLGAKADAKSTATDTTAITVMQVLKEISFMEQTPASRAVTNAGTFAVQSAESGTWNVNAQVSTGNSATTPHMCGSHVFKHITTATDTQLVAQSGSTTIYVCDYSFSFNGTGNLYLEKATTGTCGTLTQLTGAWYGAVNVAKTDANPYYRGVNTGASAQLCVNTSANVAVDIDVYYDQY